MMQKKFVFRQLSRYLYTHRIQSPLQNISGFRRSHLDGFFEIYQFENVYNLHNYSANGREYCLSLKSNLADSFRLSNAIDVMNFVVGGEWDFVIFSTVRSRPRYRIENVPTRGWQKENLGFIKDENQTNVALTRAREGLIIVGMKVL